MLESSHGKIPLLALFALAACTTTQPPPKIVTVESKIPVPVYCVKADQIPAEPPQVAEQLTGNAGHDIGVIAISALELRKWGREQAALLTACIEPEGE